MAGVELRNIHKAYGSFTAVTSVSLEVEEGEFIALLGPSGCGKTTTLRMIAGFAEPTSGDILVDGRSMRGVPPHKRNIGVVFQSYALFPHLSVFDNVAFGLRMRHVPDADVRHRVRHALELVRLDSLEARFPKELSGGQQQRVALARALVIEPSVLLLDEPLSNLDANLREQMRFEIREIQRRSGITTVFVTHDQNEAMAAADRLVIMADGRIRQIGTPREIYERPQDSFVAGFIGQTNLLPGVVRTVEGDDALVTIGPSSVVRVRNNGAVAAGRQAFLALRPEDLRIVGEAEPGANNLPGAVSRVTYLGATIAATLLVDGTTLSVLLPRRNTLPQEGDKVLLSWPPEAGILLKGHDA